MSRNLIFRHSLNLSLQDRVKNMRIGSKPMTAEQKQMNQNNVAKFAGAFLNRSDVIPIVEKSLKCETMLVAGAKAESHVKGLFLLMLKRKLVNFYFSQEMVKSSGLRPNKFEISSLAKQAFTNSASVISPSLLASILAKVC